MATATLPTKLRPSVSSRAVRAPRRFDTHQVAGVGEQIDRALGNGTDVVVIDGSDVEFADQDAVDLLALNDVDVPLRVDRPSLALQITLELLGHRPVSVLERAA